MTDVYANAANDGHYQICVGASLRREAYPGEVFITSKDLTGDRAEESTARIHRDLVPFVALSLLEYAGLDKEESGATVHVQRAVERLRQHRIDQNVLRERAKQEEELEREAKEFFENYREAIRGNPGYGGVTSWEMQPATIRTGWRAAALKAREKFSGAAE